MPGLEPGIQARSLDGRVEPGHDEGPFAPIQAEVARLKAEQEKSGTR
jgi:hypothetical protein